MQADLRSRWRSLTAVIGLHLIAVTHLHLVFSQQAIAQSDPFYGSRPPIQPHLSQPQTTIVEQTARLITVRLLTPAASGSGVLVQRQGNTYTVLTNWHVVEMDNVSTILTPDGQQQQIIRHSIRRLGRADLAIVQFSSYRSYQIAAIAHTPFQVGDWVYASGFPMYQETDLQTTFKQGIWNLRLTEGVISLRLEQPLHQGYSLGYTNKIVVGMSGGPILNQQGELIGINGRVQGRDPSFGAYIFEDGTEPSEALLEQMLHASWGIPINTYLQFITNGAKGHEPFTI